MKLSLCIATYNEESNIHYPLDSAYDLVDEVIVVDGGSTDKTVEIARSYGKKIRVYNEKYEPMFHINKQKAIDRAKGEWILQLDSDEALSVGLKQEIAKWLDGYMVKKNSHLAMQPFNYVAFWIPRKNFFLTRFLSKGGQYPDYTIRLYKNGVARFPLKSIHENVEIKGGIGHLNNPILHYADPNFSRYLMRWDRYTNLEAEELVKKLRTMNYKLQTVWIFFEYFFIKPSITFFSMYFRHLGFLDGFPGFVFALFSSIRFWVIYIKWRLLWHQPT